jgi:hypothetical protein
MRHFLKTDTDGEYVPLLAEIEVFERSLAAINLQKEAEASSSYVDAHSDVVTEPIALLFLFSTKRIIRANQLLACLSRPSHGNFERISHNNSIAPQKRCLLTCDDLRSV